MYTLSREFDRKCKADITKDLNCNKQCYNTCKWISEQPAGTKIYSTVGSNDYTSSF